MCNMAARLYSALPQFACAERYISQLCSLQVAGVVAKSLNFRGYGWGIDREERKQGRVVLLSICIEQKLRQNSYVPEDIHEDHQSHVEPLSSERR